MPLLNDEEAVQMWLRCNGETNHSNKAKILKFAHALQHELSARAGCHCEHCYHPHASDCAVHNKGVPELYGPCDCGVNES